MKKHLTVIFLCLFILLSTNSFAQIDSSKLANTQRQIDKDQKKADRLERRAKKQEKKQRRHEKKMERKNKKMQRKLNDIDKGERKLENIRKDSTGTGLIFNLYPANPIQSKKRLTYFLPVSYNVPLYRNVLA